MWKPGGDGDVQLQNCFRVEKLQSGDSPMMGGP